MAAHRFGFSLLLGITLVCATAPTIDASPILDQSQTTLGNGGTVFCESSGTSFLICGQSFTVGVTGTLTSVDFYLYNATGTPEATLYTDVTDSGATLAQTSTTPLVFGGEAFYSFLFNYAVSAGDVLFFGFHVEGDGESITAAQVADHTYLSGTTFYFIPDFGSGVISGDTAFRTFVEPNAPVPEPATLTLLGVGLAGMAARRWRQRKKQ